MIPLAVPDISGKEKEYLNRCVDTTFVSSVGEYVNSIEKMMAEKTGTRYGVATSAGTTGLHLALVGSGIQSGEIVIMPSYTFIATANAIAHCGATPWLMDIDPSTWTISIKQLEREFKEHTKYVDGKLIHKESNKRVAAIVPVYTLGTIPDMEALNEIAREYGLPVIADAAAAIGATHKGKKVGELADLTVFSFNGNKTVTAGGGGMIVGNDCSLMQKLKHLSTTARISDEYDHDMIGYNYRMTNLQAAVGCAQLERMDEFVQKKKEVRRFYHAELGSLENIALFPDAVNGESSCWFSGIVLKDGGMDRIRGIVQKMREYGIEARSFWKPVHLQVPYKNALCADNLGYTESIWDKIITLPSSTNITLKDLRYVADTLRHILQE